MLLKLASKEPRLAPAPLQLAVRDVSSKRLGMVSIIHIVRVSTVLLAATLATLLSRVAFVIYNLACYLNKVAQT